MRLPLIAVVVLASLLPGQAQRPTEPVHPDKQRVVEEVMRKRKDMREGKIERFNVRVNVKLNNGSKLNGVVKNGRLVEREAGIDFVEADRNTPEAGIRLYYFDETTSFVFLRWADIAAHKVVVKLTDEEVRAIEKEMLERERKRNEERQAAAQAAVDGKTPAPKPPEAPGDKKGDKGKDKDKAQEKESPTPLLDEFPVSEGWSEAKAQEIQRRKIAVGVYPNEREKRFLEVLGEWKKQHAQSQAGGAKATPSRPTPPTAPQAPSTPSK
jgi:hypothetical protein